MTPYLGQGASTLIEDGAFLSQCLDEVDRDGLQYWATGKPRTSGIQQTPAHLAKKAA